MRVLLAIGIVILGLGCSEKPEGGKRNGAGASGGSAGFGGSSGETTGGAGGESAGSSGASTRGGAGGSSGASAGSGTGGGTTGGAGGTGAEGGETGASGAGAGGSAGAGQDLVPLPPGSREHEDIVNLVDSAAAFALEEYILDQTVVPSFLRDGLVTPLNLFFDYYLEEYDFVFLFTDHWIEGGTFAGRFEAINRPAVPGGTDEIEIALGGFRTTGRTKGAVVVPYYPEVGPPLAHEVLHYWANYLDPAFGFGVGRTEDVGLHWGYAGVYGQLGGFDPMSLRCETPVDALPPGCTPTSGGRTRYVTSAFGSYSNGFLDLPYSPLELYLMGLIPMSEAPAAIDMLIDAETVGAPATLDDPQVIEAQGLVSLPLADIVARHGTVPELATTARTFSAAFVVISSTPAQDSVLDEIAEWAAAFGERGTSPIQSSFQTYTGGRARMQTAIGARRPVGAEVPPERERFECDLLAQDCGRPELACYAWPPNICVLHGGVTLDQPCAAIFACAPGLVCVAGQNAPDDYVCKPFCDSTVTSGPDACNTLCPGAFVELMRNGEPAGAFCVPS